MPSKLASYAPFSPPNMWGEMNDMFNHIFDVDLTHAYRSAMPITATSTRMHSIVRDDTGLQVSIDLPGVRPGDLEATVLGNELTIRTKRGDVQHVNRYTIHQDYDVAAATAKLTDGVLTLSFPKHPNAKARRLEVQTT